MKKTNLLSLILTLGLAGLAPATHAAMVALSDTLVSEPVVNLYPGEAPVTRIVTAGQLVEVQIRYPISPPFAQSAEIVVSRSNKPLIKPVGVYHIPNPTASNGVMPAMGVGLLGVGYLGAWVKVDGSGEARCTVRLRMSDGTIKKIPLVFDIQASAQ